MGARITQRYYARFLHEDLLFVQPALPGPTSHSTCFHSMGPHALSRPLGKRISHFRQPSGLATCLECRRFGVDGHLVSRAWACAPWLLNPYEVLQTHDADRAAVDAVC